MGLCLVMKLKHPSENSRNIWNELNTRSEDFEYFLLLNSLFEQFEIKIINIIDQIIYQIMRINQIIYQIMISNQKPKENRIILNKR